MSRTYAVLALLGACTINGKAIGPHLGGGTPAPAPAPSTSTSPWANDPAPGEPSSTPEHVVVPDLIGLTHAQADAALQRAGFRSPVQESPDLDSREDCWNGTHVDTVCRQKQQPGDQWTPRTNIYVQYGKPADGPVVVMPDLRGMKQGDAEAALHQLGFQIVNSGPMGHCATGTVCRQEFPPGATVRLSNSVGLGLGY
jgi:beta-lactam-binding protein with PASTA domain